MPQGPPASDEALAEALAALGPFFAVHRHTAAGAPAGTWRPVAELGEPGPALHARIERVRSALAATAGIAPGDVDRRVAVSVAQLGLVARLLAPTIGAAALGTSIGTSDDGMWWQDELGGPFPLSVPAGPAVPSGPAGTNPVSGPRLSGSAVEAITLACLRDHPVSARVLWGNVASAANGAAAMIGRARPDLAEPARIAADGVLADARVEDGALRAGPAFRRRSCCLIYRLTGARTAVCGDCVLTIDGPTDRPTP